MVKYRKKPIEVEVSGQFFSNQSPYPAGVYVTAQDADDPQFGNKCVVMTIHGQETNIDDGDWIIQEPDGEHYYPCKPDIFEATYELVL